MKFDDLTGKQIDELWGDGGPYSQVQLITEERILDDSISRVFLIIMTNINPFTFKYVKKHKKRFANDQFVRGLLEGSKYMGFKDGYCCYAFQCQYYGDEALQEAKKMLEITRKAVIRMHRFVMDELGLNVEKQNIKNVVKLDGHKINVH